MIGVGTVRSLERGGGPSRITEWKARTCQNKLRHENHHDKAARVVVQGIPSSAEYRIQAGFSCSSAHDRLTCVQDTQWSGYSFMQIGMQDTFGECAKLVYEDHSCGLTNLETFAVITSAQVRVPLPRRRPWSGRLTVSQLHLSANCVTLAIGFKIHQHSTVALMLIGANLR